MNAENRHRQTIRSYRRNVRTGSDMHFYCHEVHTLFEELIDKPWGVVRWHPAVDVCEKEDAFVIETDVPGVAAEDVRILARGRTLVIEGQRQVTRTEPARSALLCERPAGRFTRTFHFECPFESERIEHRMQDGVLVVTVPKSQSKQEEKNE